MAYENALQGQMVVHVSTQYPHFTRKYVADILEIPMNSVQIIQEMVGGSFGGKEEGIGLLAARAAYLSLLYEKAGENGVYTGRIYPVQFKTASI